MDIRIVPLGAPELLAAFDEVIAVYRAVFAEPPYDEDEEDVRHFARHGLPRHMAYPGFRFLAAQQGASLLGFAYGYTGRPGEWWNDVVAAGLPPHVTARWLPGHFELAELAVLPAARGRGTGGRLHDALLAGLPHPTAMLSTWPGETPALRLYRKRGWQVLDAHFLFPGIDEPAMIMGLRLPGPRGIVVA